MDKSIPRATSFENSISGTENPEKTVDPCLLQIQGTYSQARSDLNKEGLRGCKTSICETCKKVNPGQFPYEKVNSTRVLTNPNIPKYNCGYDNENHDYILFVNDMIGSLESPQRYVVTDLMGKGTFGQVVKCWDSKYDDFVAIKLVKNLPAFYQQGLMEAQLLERLNQTFDTEVYSIVKMYEYFIFRNHLCLVFELLGTSLYELVKQNQFQGLSINHVAILATQILKSLTALFDAHIIHCDLKPENILLENAEVPTLKVIDFGLACLDYQTIYTYIQSRFYRAPEIILGLPYTTAIDVWSLGCICFELFVGLPIFPGVNQHQMLARFIKMLGPPPKSLLYESKEVLKFFNYIPNDFVSVKNNVMDNESLINNVQPVGLSGENINGSFNRLPIISLSNNNNNNNNTNNSPVSNVYNYVNPVNSIDSKSNFYGQNDQYNTNNIVNQNIASNIDINNNFNRININRMYNYDNSRCCSGNNTTVNERANIGSIRKIHSNNNTNNFSNNHNIACNLGNIDCRNNMFFTNNDNAFKNPLIYNNGSDCKVIPNKMITNVVYNPVFHPLGLGANEHLVHNHGVFPAVPGHVLLNNAKFCPDNAKSLGKSHIPHNYINNFATRSESQLRNNQLYMKGIDLENSDGIPLAKNGMADASNRNIERLNPINYQNNNGNIKDSNMIEVDGNNSRKTIPNMDKPMNSPSNYEQGKTFNSENVVNNENNLYIDRRADVLNENIRFQNVNNKNIHSVKQFSSGGNFYLKTEEEFWISEGQVNELQKPMKVIFQNKTLAQIILGDLADKATSELTVSELDELDRRKALLSLLQIVFNWEAKKRWVPPELLQHPFITGKKMPDDCIVPRPLLPVQSPNASLKLGLNNFNPAFVHSYNPSPTMPCSSFSYSLLAGNLPPYAAPSTYRYSRPKYYYRIYRPVLHPGMAYENFENKGDLRPFKNENSCENKTHLVNNNVPAMSVINNCSKDRLTTGNQKNRSSENINYNSGTSSDDNNKTSFSSNIDNNDKNKNNNDNKNYEKNGNRFTDEKIIYESNKIHVDNGCKEKKIEIKRNYATNNNRNSNTNKTAPNPDPTTTINTNYNNNYSYNNNNNNNSGSASNSMEPNNYNDVRGSNPSYSGNNVVNTSNSTGSFNDKCFPYAEYFPSLRDERAPLNRSSVKTFDSLRTSKIIRLPCRLCDNFTNVKEGYECKKYGFSLEVINEANPDNHKTLEYAKKSIAPIRKSVSRICENPILGTVDYANFICAKNPVDCGLNLERKLVNYGQKITLDLSKLQEDFSQDHKEELLSRTKKSRQLEKANSDPNFHTILDFTNKSCFKDSINLKSNSRIKVKTDILSNRTKSTSKINLKASKFTNISNDDDEIIKKTKFNEAEGHGRSSDDNSDRDKIYSEMYNNNNVFGNQYNNGNRGNDGKSTSEAEPANAENQEQIIMKGSGSSHQLFQVSSFLSSYNSPSTSSEIDSGFRSPLFTIQPSQ